MEKINNRDAAGQNISPGKLLEAKTGILKEPNLEK